MTGSQKYGVILADPPWLYSNWGAGAGNVHTRTRGAAKHYPAMSVKQLAALPIASLAEDRCALFLWVTWPQIENGLQLIKDWGFTYKTLAWEWIKLSKNGRPAVGMGYYTRGNAEPCLLAFRGKPIPPAVRNISAVLLSPRRQHSQKPEQQYENIELLYPGLAKIELFARERHPGWHVWGNDVDSDIEM